MKWVQLLTPIYTKAQSGLAQAVSVSLGPSSLHDPLGFPVGTLCSGGQFTEGCPTHL